MIIGNMAGVNMNCTPKASYYAVRVAGDVDTTLCRLSVIFGGGIFITKIP